VNYQNGIIVAWKGFIHACNVAINCGCGYRPGTSPGTTLSV
jgi:hypothetical protein